MKNKKIKQYRFKYRGFELRWYSTGPVWGVFDSGVFLDNFKRIIEAQRFVDKQLRRRSRL